MPRLTVSFASPAPVRAIGAQPGMASFRQPEVRSAMPEMNHADLGFDEWQTKMWTDFWMKVMHHVPGQSGPTLVACGHSVDQSLINEHRMLLLKTSPWAIPRRSRFRSCPDLPRLSAFSPWGRLRRSASDVKSDILRANLFHSELLCMCG